MKVQGDSEGVNLSSLVRPQDRLPIPEMLGFMQEILQTGARVKDAAACANSIFNKILAWKKRAGDLDAQEKMVARVLRQRPGDEVNIHNVRTAKQKLAEFSRGVGLSADEVNLLVYTSLDMDWMTNLLIQAGEFTKWFNINFEGESRDEVDFRDNKVEIWAAA